MEATFADFIQTKTLEVYLDDTIVHTNNIQQHSTILKQVFDRIREKNIKVSLEKSELVTEEVTFLGNLVSKGQLKPKPDRAKCTASKEKPTTLKGLQGWLGAANYLRKYIPDYAQITQPLYNLVDQKNKSKSKRKRNGEPDGNKVVVTWTELATKHFERLQKILCSELVLALPDFLRDMSVTTDASELGYGGQIEQNFKLKETDPDDIRPIEYFSKN